MADGNEGQSNAAGAGSNVRLKQAESRQRRPKQSRVRAASGGVAVGFVNFIRNHAVVSLAVGFVIATQVQGVIKQLVSSFITPTIQIFFSGAIAKDTFVYHINGRRISYSWGAFVTDLLDFFFVVLALYLIIRFFKLDKLDKTNT